MSVPLSSRAAAEQFDALTVLLDPGVTLVEASAGTGKTFAITRLVLRLLLERRVASLSEILVVTFTDKATQELVTRIRRVLREADLVFGDSPPARDVVNDDLFVLREHHGDTGAAIIRAALGALDDLAVSTIHGFCQRMLTENALETRMPFRTTFVQDDTEPLLRAAMDWTRSRLLRDASRAGAFVADGCGLGAMVKTFAARFRRQSGTTLAFDPYVPSQALVADFVHTVDEAFTREKSRRHLLGFDDLLRNLSTVITAEGADGPLAIRIRTQYRAALIDEFQDTDNTQYPIFSHAFSGCPLFLIGDPKQSIYGFRGADIHAYLDAADHAARRYTLTRNHRSTGACVSAVQRLFTRADRPFRYDEARIDFPKVTAATSPDAPGSLATDGQGAMVWWWVDGSLGAKGVFVAKEKAQAIIFTAVATEVVRLTAGGVPCGSIAVLLRTNAQALDIKLALDAAGVPSVIAGGDDVLASDEATELVRIAAAMASPYDRRAVSSALATRIYGSTAGEIAAAVGDGGDVAWSTITDRFAALRDIWRSRGVSAAFGALLTGQDTAERLLTLPDGARRLTNVRHVIELLHGAADDEGVVLEGVGAWVARERSVANTPDRRMQRLETDADAVQILTMHKAKGLEFDVVFCPTLFDAVTVRQGPFGLIAASARDESGRFVMDIGSAAHGERVQAMHAEEEAEALRLVYVALTRARHRSYIAFGDIGQNGAAMQSPLGYLLRPVERGQVRDVLTALVAASEGTMSLTHLAAETPAPRAAAPAVEEIELRATSLALRRDQLTTWRLTSFTGLVADAPAHVTRDVMDVAVLPDAATVAMGFRAFPGGTQVGIALHALFERVDFARVSEPATATLVASTLTSHGLAGDAATSMQRLDDVTTMVRQVCGSPIPEAGVKLSEVADDATLREWRFDMSVGSTSVRRVADVLATHGSPHAQAYAPLLRTLRDGDVAGYLGGVIDLVFEHQGRWWIVDWKSNQLGAADARYEAAVLGEVMHQAHYTLQYHLYALALHRHLRARVRAYDPALHWGGVAYAFLRGIDGSGARGWFTDRPSPTLLVSLDAALGRRA